MNQFETKLNALRGELAHRKARVMIIGLGSVGNYLLDYLMSGRDEQLALCVVGRNREKMESDVNIVRVASEIRGQNRSPVEIRAGVDLDNLDAIAEAIADWKPDIIVNSSRAYPGLKYGSISWKNIRAYGLWTPLSIKYTRNIMEGAAMASSNAIVVNTSYSDAVIPWLRSAQRPYPDLGSGNINHLIPRIQFAAAGMLQIEDYWNIDVTFAVAHFHDVVISKEGQTEGVEMLIDIRYQGRPVDLPLAALFEQCRIPMPVDAKRNMMNASSNYAIIQGILSAVRQGGRVRLHCPGAFGEIGGYPVLIDGSGPALTAGIDETYFSLDAMRQKNRESIALDGIEEIADGTLVYTDALLQKVQRVFGVSLVKKVPFAQIDDVAGFIVREIIEKNI